MKAILRGGFLTFAIMAYAVPANAGPFEDYLDRIQTETDARSFFETRLHAVQGDAQAANQPGSMYRLGMSIPKDRAEAAKWIRKVAEPGDADAQKNRDMAAGKMTPDQTTEAQRLFGEWMAKHERQPSAAAQLPVAALASPPDPPLPPSITVQDVPAIDIKPNPPVISRPAKRKVRALAPVREVSAPAPVRERASKYRYKTLPNGVIFRVR